VTVPDSFGFRIITNPDLSGVVTIYHLTDYSHTSVGTDSSVNAVWQAKFCTICMSRMMSNG